MPSKEKKILSPEEKYKLELQTEVELLRLQRQYHILERDRNAFTGSSGALAKQKKVINILKKEYNEILTDLAVAGSDANAKNDTKIADHLQKLLTEHTQFVSDIKREKAYLKELDMQITMTRKSIIELRSKSLTEQQCTQKIREDERILEALENKLEIATKRFCMTLSENRKLREEIDHLLKERAHFNMMWDRLISKLAHGKKFMLDLIEQSTIAYDKREEWCQKLHTLRIRAQSEFISHSQEMTEMQRQINNERKLEEFLTVKGQKRVMKMLMTKEEKRREEQRKEMEMLLQNYTNMLEDIKEFMGEANLVRVAEKFAETEVANFSMFKYVNDLNRELEQLSDELMSLQIKIDEQKALKEYRKTHQASRLENLDTMLNDAKAEAESALNELNKTEATLKELLGGIERMFKLCKCSNAPLMELLGDNTSINVHNALLYLEILERKINELIITVYYSEKQATDRKKGGKGNIIKDERVRHHTISITEIVNKDPCPLCVEQAMVSDVIDSLQKVMSKQELKDKLKEAIEKRGFLEVIHNVSACHLPKSRAIIQRRFQ